MRDCYVFGLSDVKLVIFLVSDERLFFILSLKCEVGNLLMRDCYIFSPSDVKLVIFWVSDMRLKRIWSLRCEVGNFLGFR